MKVLQRWKQTALHNKALVWTSVLVAFGTAFYAIAAACQIQLMKESSQQSSVQMDRLIGGINTSIQQSVKQSTEATNAAIQKNRESLDAALAQNRAELKASISQGKAALDASAESLRLEQRPWLAPGQIEMPFEPDAANNRFEFTIVLKNTGRVPSLRVISKTRPYLTIAEPPVVKISDVPFSENPNYALVPPGDPGTSITERMENLTTPQLAAYRAKVTRFYVQGAVRYEGVFGEPHWTIYCFAHQYGQGLHAASLCRYGNDVDRNTR